MKKLAILLFGFLTLTCYSQKEAYIPAYLLDPNTVDGSQFTWSKTMQSSNFTIIWGDSVGLDPLNPPDPDLYFDPNMVLDTMEMIYQAFVDFGFAWDTTGTNLHQYKVPVVMLNTFGPTGTTGWAFGGDADGIIGAFWVHPLAIQTGDVAAHEFTHSLQAQCIIDYRTIFGLGSVWNNAGIFWETHANFMRNLLYPQDVTAWGMDVYHIETWGDWKNTYENYEMLLAIMEEDGIDVINRLWRNSYSNEYPLQSYKRLMNFNQEQFNDKMFKYARRMATYDFNYNNIGDYFLQYRNNDLLNWLPSIQATYTILAQDSLIPTHFRVPIEIAPEESAYNIIPIYPDADSCAVIIKFKGHTDANLHTGWCYGFVAAFEDGTVSRYSETYNEPDAEIGFSLLENESHMYFVVMGAPDMITTSEYNDTWHGYPKHFRFPYELTISGGIPEGFQVAENFRPQLKTNGHIHSNGGGWVANTATVAPSVYVSHYAIILGNSNITGNVRIENTALVKNATMSGNSRIANNSFVVGGVISDNVVIEGQAFVENCTLWGDALIDMRAKVSNYHLHGNIEVGGDVVVYNETGDCDNGVYYRMTNYYQNNLLECDGRTATHPANLDTNNNIMPFNNNQMTIECNCLNYPDCLIVEVDEIKLNYDNLLIYPNPASDIITLDLGADYSNHVSITLYNLYNEVVLRRKVQKADKISIDITGLPQGFYTIKVGDFKSKLKCAKLIIRR
ncbi:MAG: DUF6055 domain-containing protein [Bacteroidales bacterium]|nr:DUF6055 domain-containing protein [Bacteroidales bacterium]